MKRTSEQSGFSLIELMIAMIVTIIVTGAVYGLIASGQSSFVTEPQRAERQQSIRVAMDLIARDVAAAGVGMPGFVQTFTPNLDNVVCADCGQSTTIAAQNTDELEIIANPDGWDFEPACNYPGGNSAVANMWAQTTQMQVGQYVLVFMQNGTWTLRYVTGLQNNNSASGDCDNGPKVLLQFNQGGDPNNPKINMPGGLCANGSVGTSDDNPDPATGCMVASVGLGEVVSYRIRPDPWDGTPVLQRRSTASVTGNPLDDAAYQVIARGIEDMQVQYAVADANSGTPNPEEVWVDGAPTVALLAGAPTTVQYASLIAKVRITLTARNDILAGGRTVEMKGATMDVNGNSAVRSSLSSTVVIRSTLNLIGQDRNQWAMWQ